MPLNVAWWYLVFFVGITLVTFGIPTFGGSLLVGGLCCTPFLVAQRRGVRLSPWGERAARRAISTLTPSPTAVVTCWRSSSWWRRAQRLVSWEAGGERYEGALVGYGSAVHLVALPPAVGASVPPTGTVG